MLKAVLSLFCLVNTAFAAPEPRLWLWLLPGGGQFDSGRTAKGAAYAASVAGFAAWGITAENIKDAGQVNAPLVYAQQAYILSIYEAYRDFQLDNGADRYNKRLDKTKLGGLFAAPFKRENYLSGWVIGAALFGAGVNYALARGGHPGSFARMNSMRYLGADYNRDTGAAVYSAYWIPISLGAGVSEEALFRGMIQSEWETRWGRATGLYAASGLFGAAHLSDPSRADVWANAGFAALAGLYLGWLYQHNDYKLAKPIAAHFWFDIAAGAASFLANPEANPLGAKIGYAF